MGDLFAPIPTGYDLDKIGNFVIPGQNPVLKRLFPFKNIPLPEPGFWLVRKHRLGPWCPAAIIRLQTQHEPGNPDNPMERSPFLAAFVSGEPVDIEDVWHTRGRRIAPPEYWNAVGEIRRARQRNEYDPRLYPRRPIKPSAIPVPQRARRRVNA